MHTLIDLDSIDSTNSFAKREGGHGGTDPSMIGRFVQALDTGKVADSSLEQGLAASVVAMKADEARLSGKVVTIRPDDYR